MMFWKWASSSSCEFILLHHFITTTLVCLLCLWHSAIKMSLCFVVVSLYIYFLYISRVLGLVNVSVSHIFNTSHQWLSNTGTHSTAGKRSPTVVCIGDGLHWQKQWRYIKKHCSCGTKVDLSKRQVRCKMKIEPAEASSCEFSGTN